jgi:hypothetical protein
MSLQQVPENLKNLLETSNDSFVQSVKGFNQRAGGVTPAQLAALEKVYARESLPKREGSPVTEAGVYETPEGIFRVKKSRRRCRFYALRVTATSAEYEASAILRVFAEDKMTVARAEELSLAWGQCIVCGRELTHPESVKRSIGPVCYKRLA